MIYIIIITIIILLTLYILEGYYQCLQNLQRNLGPLSYESHGVFRRRFDFGRGGPKALCVGIKRISGRVMKRRSGMPSKFSVYRGSRRDILLKYFSTPGVAAVDAV
jgi:hypothetical protein